MLLLSAMPPTSEGETNILSRSTKKVKTSDVEINLRRSTGEDEDGYLEERRKSLYRDKMMGLDSDTIMEGEDLDLEGNISEDDDEYEKGGEGPWFSMGMTKKEKIEAIKQCRLSLIIELVGRAIGYQFLLRRLQAPWRP